MNQQSLKYRVCLFLPPLVLLAIACLQLYQAHVQQLTPWKGGGFGMFSSVDGPDARFLRIYLVTADAEIPVEIPKQLQALAREIRSLPTHDRLARLAGALARSSWVPSEQQNSTAAPASSGTQASATGRKFRVKEAYEPMPPPSDRLMLIGVRVELWRYRFDSPHGQVHAYKFDEATHVVD